MTVKQFFKSTAFKSIAVLMAIVIIAGALLAIFNDLLSVSAEERFNRSLSKIYGGNAEVKETILSSDSTPVTVSGATVNQAYLMSDGNYLVQTTSDKSGYQNGTITVWTILSCTGSKASNNLQWTGIEKVVYESNDKQSYIGRFTDADYAQFAEHNTDLVAGKLFDEGITVVKTGASAPFTFAALTNAVNAAVTYFKTTILGESTEPSLYQFDSWVDLENSDWTYDIGEKTVEYSLTMKKNAPAPSFTVNVTVVDGAITEYSYEGAIASPESFGDNVDATIKDGSFFIGMTADEILAYVNEDGSKLDSANLGQLSTGATRSSEVFLYAAAFALANFETILYPVQFESWITEETHTIEGTAVSYNLTVKKNAPAPSFTVYVTVADGAITEYSYEGAIASPESFGDSVDATIKDGSFFVGMTADEILAYVNEDGGKLDSADWGTLSTGATRSSEGFLYAAAYALVNYEVFLAKGGTQA